MQIVFWHIGDPSNFSEDPPLFLPKMLRGGGWKGRDKVIQGACLDFLMKRCRKIRFVEGLDAVCGGKGLGLSLDKGFLTLTHVSVCSG